MSIHCMLYDMFSIDYCIVFTFYYTMDTIQTPQTPMVRPWKYDHFNIDNYPLGTNAIVAVISYTVSFLPYYTYIIYISIVCVCASKCCIVCNNKYMVIYILWYVRNITVDHNYGN